MQVTSSNWIDLLTFFFLCVWEIYLNVILFVSICVFKGAIVFGLEAVNTQKTQAVNEY